MGGRERKVNWGEKGERKERGKGDKAKRDGEMCWKYFIEIQS